MTNTKQSNAVRSPAPRPPRVQCNECGNRFRLKAGEREGMCCPLCRTGTAWHPINEARGAS